MVYGFIKQTGGHVKIYSEVGHGTTMRLYLPRTDKPADIDADLDSGELVGGAETILVVEDDDAVRTTVVEILIDLGYRVHEASDAANAMSIVESGIHLDRNRCPAPTLSCPS